jgi:hypothetical protein
VNARYRRKSDRLVNAGGAKILPPTQVGRQLVARQKKHPSDPHSVASVNLTMCGEFYGKIQVVRPVILPPAQRKMPADRFGAERSVAGDASHLGSIQIRPRDCTLCRGEYKETPGQRNALQGLNPNAKHYPGDALILDIDSARNALG